MTACQLIMLCVFVVLAPHQNVLAEQPLKYNRDILPILANNCFACHGFDPKTREADLRLDTQEAAFAPLESGEGQAIAPGDPVNSVLLERIISHDADVKMPPVDSEKNLTKDEIDKLRQWIIQGAKYERHWAFVAPEATPVPSTKLSTWPRNLVDHFILARLEKEGLAPTPAADRRVLIRRVAQDVTGLPPTPEEILTFLDDNSPDAYEKMVDRYFTSPSYGEHMTRYWLDLARYADTSGYQYDQERTMWVWRDWVINAYNNNMPFDQFTVEQLAGDLLPNAQPHQILATGFNRNHPITIEGGVIDEEYRTEYVIDRLTTTSTVWMGLTMGCARCHDHKFDPISQKDFYRLFAFFNQVPERGLNGFAPNKKIISPLAKEHSQETQVKIAALKKHLSAVKEIVADSVTEKTAVENWARQVATSKATGWEVLDPIRMSSSGGSKLEKQSDYSIVAGGANPQKDIYEIAANTEQTGITAIRLECLTHPSLPGGGPGRHTNSNFVLSEFELVAVSIKNPKESQPIKFSRAKADYEQAGYEVSKSIDGSANGNSGWAVDGPTRKEPSTALFFASKPFGYNGGTELVFKLKHEASFATHGVGRPRLSITHDAPATVQFGGIPAEINRIATLDPASRTATEFTQLQKYYRVIHASEVKSIESQIDTLSNANAAAYPPTMIMQDQANLRQTQILILGQYDRKGDVVTAGVPEVLMPMPEGAPVNRLGFAKWLVDPKHPLTARVAVNRYWQRIFGTGLVKTSNDFGTQGEWPSHPDLLDSLAAKFIENGWDVKAIQRLILTSATYRQSPHVSAELYERDPENRLLARGPRFRLDAEQIRDQALAVSGLLVEKVGGPSVYPYQPDGLWMELNNRPGLSKAYKSGTGDDLYRRSMYTFWKRTVPSPMLTTFDAPDREFCTVSRSRTNTPLQALLLLQGPQYVEAARRLASRMMSQGGQTVENRIAFGFELTTARKPSSKEIVILSRVYHERLKDFQTDPEAAIKMLSVGDSARDTNLDLTQHAAWTEVARLLLNLDETVTKG